MIMKKIYSIIASAIIAVGFTACTQSDFVETSAPDVSATSIDNAIQFGTYMGKGGSTRAGATGAITSHGTGTHQLGETGYEFGVFAVYGSSTAYNSLTSRVPNFMYNEKVYWDGTNNVFKYDNLKYWPNGKASSTDNNADDQNATSTTLNYLNFFAYAPYVDKSSALSDTYGIIEINGSSTAIASETSGTGKNAVNNPVLKYKLDPENVVDLLWGTAGTNGVTVKDGAQNGGVVNTTTDGSSITTSAQNAGKNVNIDMTKMKTNGKVNFNFLHALGMLGGTDGTLTSGVKIQAVTDDASNITGAETKITVVDLTIQLASVKDRSDVSHTGYATEGYFDLARGTWYNQTYSGSADTHIYYAPGSASYAGATAAQKVLNTDIAEPASFTWIDGTPAGVITASKKNVFAADVPALYLIPDTKPTYNVTITYIVRTKDSKLAAGWSEVTQSITKTIEFGDFIKLNKCYNLLIKLGLTSVKFEATVSDWSTDINDDSNDSNDEQVVDLPINVTGA